MKKNNDDTSRRGGSGSRNRRGFDGNKNNGSSSNNNRMIGTIRMGILKGTMIGMEMETGTTINLDTMSTGVNQEEGEWHKLLLVVIGTIPMGTMDMGIKDTIIIEVTIIIRMKNEGMAILKTTASYTPIHSNTPTMNITTTPLLKIMTIHQTIRMTTIVKIKINSTTITIVNQKNKVGMEETMAILKLSETMLLPIKIRTLRTIGKTSRGGMEASI